MATTEKKKYRNWLLTIAADRGWNPPSTLPKNIKYMAGQLECGETTNYLHWQIYVSMDNAYRFQVLKKRLNCEWARCEGARNPRACILYVTKDATSRGGRFELGVRDKRYKIKDFKTTPLDKSEDVDPTLRYKNLEEGQTHDNEGNILPNKHYINTYILGEPCGDDCPNCKWMAESRGLD